MARPNWLSFLEGTHEYSGGNIGQRIFFNSKYFLSVSKMYGHRRGLQLVSMCNITLCNLSASIYDILLLNNFYSVYKNL